MDPVSLDLALLFPFKRNKASLLIMNWWKKIMIYSIAFHFSDEPCEVLRSAGAAKASIASALDNIYKIGADTDKHLNLFLQAKC